MTGLKNTQYVEEISIPNPRSFDVLQLKEKDKLCYTIKSLVDFQIKFFSSGPVSFKTASHSL